MKCSTNRDKEQKKKKGTETINCVSNNFKSF